jgi:hypothetical protein
MLAVRQQQLQLGRCRTPPVRARAVIAARSQLLLAQHPPRQQQLIQRAAPGVPQHARHSSSSRQGAARVPAQQQPRWLDVSTAAAAAGASAFEGAGDAPAPPPGLFVKKVASECMPLAAAGGPPTAGAVSTSWRDGLSTLTSSRQCVLSCACRTAPCLTCASLCCCSTVPAVHGRHYQLHHPPGQACRRGDGEEQAQCLHPWGASTESTP